MNHDITLSAVQAYNIAIAPVHGAYGSAERIRVKEDLEKALREGIPTTITISLSSEELDGWAAGIISGWSQETMRTMTGVVPMTDVDRNLLRLAAKALRVWGMVKKKLPKVEAVEVELDPEVGDLELDEVEG